MRRILLALSLGLLSSCASFPEEIDNFRFAAMSPLRDFNLTQAPIPGQLNALQQPYGYIDQSGCQVWTQEVDSLQAALMTNDGRRVGFRRDSETFVGRTGNLRDSGIKSATSRFIPFRSIVRQASGASRFEQRAARASDRARYRIGYLVGLGRAHRCPGFGVLSPFAPRPNTQAAWTRTANAPTQHRLSGYSGQPYVQPTQPQFRTQPQIRYARPYRQTAPMQLPVQSQPNYRRPTNPQPSYVQPTYIQPSYSRPASVHPSHANRTYTHPNHRIVASIPYGTAPR